MVITETGAATAAAKALPVLKGKLTGNAIRVPTPNVSMAVLNLNLEKACTREEINEYLRQMAMHSDLQKQIDFVSSQEVVSTDFVGSRHAPVWSMPKPPLPTIIAWCSTCGTTTSSATVARWYA